MLVTADIKKVRKIVNSAKVRSKLIGFVPTMGALHRGHLSLIKAARRESDFLVASIFVNPAQFSSGREDFRKYPRQFKRDKSLLRKEGVGLVFHPSVKVIYPDDFSSFVEERDLSRHLCGIRRPGHFRGVCTIVSKLFNIVQPDIVFFGQKDYQQAQIIRRLIQDLNFPIEINILPIVRERNGLALSSRNKYLTPQQTKDALILYRALKLAKAEVSGGQIDSAKIIMAMRRLIISVKSAKIDYLEIVDAKSLKKLRKIKGKILIALAVSIGRTRLIDNIILNVK